MTQNSFKFEQFDEDKEDWKYYLERFELTERLEGLMNQTDADGKMKKLSLLNAIGAIHFRRIRKIFPNKSIDQITYAEIKAVMKKKHTIKHSVTFERFRFTNTYREDNQSIKEFIAWLQELSIHCEFKDTLEERIRDQFIIGIRDKVIQQELLKNYPDNSTKLEDVVK